MKIFVIKGKENSGKTNAIRNIFQTIIKGEHGKVLFYEPKGADYCDFITGIELKGKKNCNQQSWRLRFLCKEW